MKGKNAEQKKKSETNEKPTYVIINLEGKPVQRSVFEWGKYRVVDEVVLEKNPKKIREVEKFYD
jgi:hypothetical protein